MDEMQTNRQEQVTLTPRTGKTSIIIKSIKALIV
jgi:hypothetical protein